MRSVRLFFALLVASLSSSWLWAGQLVVFGDSLSDVGNVYADSVKQGLTPDPPSPPYYSGRMSNGPIWVDYLAQMIGLSSPEASQKGTGGTGYAYAGSAIGAGTRERTSIAIPGQKQIVSDTGKQINEFLGASVGGFSPDQLVLFWSGSQNLLQATLTGGFAPGLGVVAASIAELEIELRKLNANGAQRVVVPNQIDASSAPFFNGYGPAGLNTAGTRQLLRGLTQAFNTQLDTMLDQLMADPTFQVQVYPVDMFGLFETIKADPAAYGFTEPSKPYLPVGASQAADPKGYLFWDPIHPTTEGHRLIAKAAYSAIIPVPGTLPLLVLALGVLAAGRHRRA